METINKNKKTQGKKSVLFFFNSQEASCPNQKRAKENNLLETTIQIKMQKQSPCGFSVKKVFLKIS